MKIAVLSDIHSNISALQTVTEHVEAWQPDQVVVAGDLVNRGPRPLECLRFVQEMERTRGWLTLIGNHEEYVISHATTGEPRSGPQFEIKRSSYWTYNRLGGDVSPLVAMPFKLALAAPDGSEVRLTHASMRGTRAGIYTFTPDRLLCELIGQPLPPLFCVGHTHMPWVRRINGTLVVNAGSAGLPFDGDRRASYAQLTWHKGEWQANIVRLDYDRQQAERDFADSGFLDEGGPLAQLILIELRSAHSQLFQWAARYEKPLLAGEITMEESVRQFMGSNGLARLDILGFRLFQRLPMRAQRLIANRLMSRGKRRAESAD
jgi:predicted phosphodiesterase